MLGCAAQCEADPYTAEATGRDGTGFGRQPRVRQGDVLAGGGCRGVTCLRTVTENMPGARKWDSDRNDLNFCF